MRAATDDVFCVFKALGVGWAIEKCLHVILMNFLFFKSFLARLEPEIAYSGVCIKIVIIIIGFN